MVIPDDAYGGTYRLFAKVAQRWGLDWTAGDGLRPRRRAGRDPPGPTKIVWVETPTNPLLGIADIAALAGVAHEAARCWWWTTRSPRRTCSSRSRLGADVVVHSTTKYVGGHSDVVGGALVAADDGARRRARASTRTRWARSTARSTRGSPCAASRPSAYGWTGTATTPSGSRSSCSGHPAVAQVLYPGLPEHPGHEVAAKQMRRFGGMV